MRRLLVLLSVLLVLSPSCWAEVVLTDQDHQELVEILDQLEILNEEQKLTIENLQTQNEELQRQSESKQEILNEQEKTLQQQARSLKEEKKSSTLTIIVSNIITALLSFIIGVLVC